MRLHRGERSSGGRRGDSRSRSIGRIVPAFLALALSWMQAASAAEAPAPQTLTVWNRPIVTFRATVGTNGPGQRLANTLERIDELGEFERLKPVAFHEVRVGNLNGMIVTVGGQTAFGLVQGDVDPESGLSLEQVTQRAANELRAAFAAQAEQRRPSVLFRGIGLTVFVALGVLAIIWLMRKARERGIRRLDDFLKRLRLVVAGVDIMPTLATLERAMVRVVGWAVIVSVVYLSLVFVLQQFPYTEPFGLRLGAYLREQLGGALMAFIRWLPRLALVVAVLLVTRAVTVWTSRLLAEVEKGVREVSWLRPEQARATRRIAVGFLWVIGIVIAYPLLPWSNNLIFQGVSVVFGLALSIASSGLVNQWISGLVILYSRSFRIGDFIAVGDTEGVVTEMGPLATKLRTIRREEITLPNAVIVTGKLTNYTRLGEGAGAMYGVWLAIGYDVPWKQVHELLLQAAAHTKHVRHDPPPRVLQWELSDFSVTYRLDVNLERAEDRLAVRSELNSRILDAFAAAGVQIMTPHFESQPEKPVIAPVGAA